jgi:uncharacterized protein YecE (DUF72 family)
MSVSTSPTTIPLHVGAVLDRAPGPKYVSALAFAELAFRQPLPKPKVLAQLKRQAPEGFAFALRAPRESVVSKHGALRMTPEVEAGLAWLLAAADACAAKAVVIPTPADFTPGARSRELLREFIGRLPRPEGRHYVWLPGGLWEPHETEVIAAELGIVAGFDPLESRRPAGPVAYGTLRAMGHRTSFSPAAMADALETLLTAETREAFVSVDAERAFDVARRLRQLATSVFAEAAAASEEDDDERDDDEDEDEYAASGDDSDEGDEDSDDESEDEDDEDSDDESEDDDDSDDSGDDDESEDDDSDDEESDDEKPSKRGKQGKQGRP